MTGAPAFTIILPCYNEAARIASSLSTLDSWFGPRAEVIVVDDGSADGTSERARAASRGNVRVHRLDVNRGKGAAVRAAVPFVRTPHVLVMDADVVFDCRSVERILTGLENADVVVGNRRHAESRYSVPVRLFGFLYRRHLVGLTFNAFVRGLLPVSLRDTQCGLKGFRREALEAIGSRLTIDGFAFDVEMLLVARGLKLRLAEAPVQVTYESAKSSVELLRGAVTMASSILTIAARHAAGRYRAGSGST